MFRNLKTLLLATALAAVSMGAQALQETPIVSATRISTGTATSADMYARDQGSGARDGGIIVTSVVTTVTGSASLTMTVQGKTPAGEYYDLAASTATQAVVATPNVLYIHPGITAAAGSAVALPLPPVFRVKATITGTGSATYAVGVSRTN